SPSLLTPNKGFDECIDLEGESGSPVYKQGWSKIKEEEWLEMIPLHTRWKRPVMDSPTWSSLSENNVAGGTYLFFGRYYFPEVWYQIAEELMPLMGCNGTRY